MPPPPPLLLLLLLLLLQEDVISPEDLDAMNRWLDDHPEAARIRPPEQMLDGRTNDYHPFTDQSDERYMGSEPAQRLTGTHGRADVAVGTQDWADESTKPFRDLISNPHIVRCAFVYRYAAFGLIVRFSCPLRLTNAILPRLH